MDCIYSIIPLDVAVIYGKELRVCTVFMFFNFQFLRLN